MLHCDTFNLVVLFYLKYFYSSMRIIYEAIIGCENFIFENVANIHIKRVATDLLGYVRFFVCWNILLKYVFRGKSTLLVLCNLYT